MACIGSLSQKRSPVVQSGDMSQPANIIIGDNITVIIQSAEFTNCIPSLSHLDSVSVVPPPPAASA
jgi:hypothetical protein